MELPLQCREAGLLAGVCYETALLLSCGQGDGFTVAPKGIGHVRKCVGTAIKPRAFLQVSSNCILFDIGMQGISGS